METRLSLHGVIYTVRRETENDGVSEMTGSCNAWAAREARLQLGQVENLDELKVGFIIPMRFCSGSPGGRSPSLATITRISTTKRGTLDPTEDAPSRRIRFVDLVSVTHVKL